MSCRVRTFKGMVWIVLGLLAMDVLFENEICQSSVCIDRPGNLTRKSQAARRFSECCFEMEQFIIVVRNLELFASTN